jgi:serine/threonine-protein kinase
MRIGPFEVQGELGRGGMGVVYRALDPRTGAARAIKLVAGRSDPEAFARVRREAEALARVGGAGVVPIHETGVDNGRVYLAMDIMAGGSLGARLKAAGKLDGREAIAIVASLARTLERCHQAGLVHRDVKPDNVLFDEEGRPCLADFGCVRDVGAASLTETGTVLGTPAYMSPEQLDGAKVDARADVYALGAILFELVTGERLFAEAPSVFKLLEAKRAARVPSVRAIAGTPSGLDGVLARALAPLEGRYESAAALEVDLRALGKKAKPRSGPGPLGAVALVISLLAVGLAVSRGRAPSPPPGSTLPPPRPAAHSLPKAPLPDVVPATQDRVAVLTSEIALHPTDLAIRLERGQLLLERGRLDEAQADADAVLRSHPRDEQAHFLHGRVCAIQGGLAATVDDLHSLRENQELFRELGAFTDACHGVGKDMAVVASVTTLLLAVQPDDDDLLFRRGRAYSVLALEQGHGSFLPLALADLERFLAHRQDDAEALWRRLLCRKALGETVGGADLDHVLRVDPRNNGARLYRFWARQHAGDAKGARGDLDKIVRVAADGIQGGGPLAAEIGLGFHALGDETNARKYLEVFFQNPLAPTPQARIDEARKVLDEIRETGRPR